MPVFIKATCDVSSKDLFSRTRSFYCSSPVRYRNFEGSWKQLRSLFASGECMRKSWPNYCNTLGSIIYRSYLELWTRSKKWFRQQTDLEFCLLPHQISANQLVVAENISQFWFKQNWWWETLQVLSEFPF